MEIWGKLIYQSFTVAILDFFLVQRMGSHMFPIGTIKLFTKAIDWFVGV